jgi:serine/threonine protein kinase
MPMVNGESPHVSRDEADLALRARATVIRPSPERDGSDPVLQASEWLASGAPIGFRRLAGRVGMALVDLDLCPPRYRDPCASPAADGRPVPRESTRCSKAGRRELLAERFAADVEIRSRFRREATAAARSRARPNTVTIFDVGEWRGTPFIVMEYLSGGTLRHVLRRGAASRARCRGSRRLRSRSTPPMLAASCPPSSPRTSSSTSRRVVRVATSGSQRPRGSTRSPSGYGARDRRDLAPEQAQGSR